MNLPLALLFQVVFYARLAEEDGHFDFHDVVDGVTAKMIRRHPHVFGDADARTQGEVRGQWERIKAEERSLRAAKSGDEPPTGALDDIPLGLPALLRAAKLQDKAARLGFDWPSLAPVLAKLREEWTEFETELVDPGSADTQNNGSLKNSYDMDAEQKQRATDELGDMMFVLANVARHLGIDPEAATRGANAKFVRRFRHIEARLAEAGKTPADSDLEEMDGFWNEARQAEKQSH